MNPGDMVMVVRPRTPAFAGAIGELLALEQHEFDDGRCLGALIQFPRPMPWRRMGHDPCRGWMLASRVIKIDSPPGRDETLTWCPQPIKETV